MKNQTEQQQETHRETENRYINEDNKTTQQTDSVALRAGILVHSSKESPRIPRFSLKLDDDPY